MVTVLRSGGLRIVIYRVDHEPPHVHVFGDGETKIELGASALEIKAIYSIHTTQGERRRAERAVRANHAFLFGRWLDLHG